MERDVEIFGRLSQSGRRAYLGGGDIWEAVLELEARIFWGGGIRGAVLEWAVRILFVGGDIWEAVLEQVVYLGVGVFGRLF